MKRLRLCVHGRVQGVGYRAWSAGEAARLGLDGWVRNRADGSVELALSGDDEAVERMLALCREGPRAAAVIRVDVLDEPEAVDEGFRQLTSL